MALTAVDELRSMIGDTTLTDPELQEIIVAKGSLNAAAAYIWSSKSASTVGLVDISESGSSRKMSEIHQQALRMADYYRGLADNEGQVEGMHRGRVNYIERP